MSARVSFVGAYGCEQTNADRDREREPAWIEVKRSLKTVRNGKRGSGRSAECAKA